MCVDPGTGGLVPDALEDARSTVAPPPSGPDTPVGAFGPPGAQSAKCWNRSTIIYSGLSITACGAVSGGGSPMVCTSWVMQVLRIRLRSATYMKPSGLASVRHGTIASGSPE